ncbi:MAG: NAD(P)H-binding protein [Candidatus Aminicenantes bacterium]|nr:NAD(P)H-binding protein [Candidatus Aminicenantes bacterium]
MKMTILLTGATGYIGGQVLDVLGKEQDVGLRLLVRDKSRFKPRGEIKAELFEGSTFDGSSLRRALRGVDVAYYLIHSMAAKGDFETLDRQSAANFLAACLDEKVHRIIYLGGLGRKDTASRHLLSRIETGEILSSRPDRIQTIWFRAGVIIGAGSASFEIIRSLVRKLPVLTTPRWVQTCTEPIGVGDVVRYLAAARNLDTEGNLMVDIGSEKLTFQEMLQRAARVMGLRRWIVPVPLLSPRISSLWLILFAPVNFRVARSLVDGLRSETVVTNANARTYFPRIEPVSYEAAVRLAVKGRPRT